MKASVAYGLLLAAAPRALAATSQVRGVGPDFSKFYTSTSTFACISNPALTIPFSRVNDDYCDCPDGSDEPGTAACAHLSPLSPHIAGSSADVDVEPALPGYYCRNAGHNPEYIPFTLVNDGVCDYDRCCDGSDEWAGVGGVKCENRCKNIGKEWRRLDEARRTSAANALKKRAALVAEAGKVRAELEAWIKEHEPKLASLEANVKTLERERDEIERQERGRLVKGAAKGTVGVLAGLAKARLTEYRDALATLRKQRNAYHERVNELERLLEGVASDYNPNFNDEPVKNAVKAFRDYQARDKPSHGGADFETDLSAFTAGDDGISWDEFKGEPESDVDVLYQFEEYLPVPLRDFVDQKLRDLKVFLIDKGILAAPQGSNEESPKVKDAKERVRVAQQELDTFKSQKESKEKDLDTDFGKDGAFRALKDKCIQKDAGEYTYELCWMGGTAQISKKGGSRNAMGYFKEFTTTHVDEDVAVDGKGLGTGERVVMKYADGSHCWQGPNRSTTVVLACAEEDEIWKVLEEEKCVYRMEVGTPAVCEPAARAAEDAANKAAPRRDEL